MNKACFLRHQPTAVILPISPLPGTCCQGNSASASFLNSVCLLRPRVREILGSEALHTLPRITGQLGPPVAGGFATGWATCTPGLREVARCCTCSIQRPIARCASPLLSKQYSQTHSSFKVLNTRSITPSCSGVLGVRSFSRTCHWVSVSISIRTNILWWRSRRPRRGDGSEQSEKGLHHGCGRVDLSGYGDDI